MTPAWREKRDPPKWKAGFGGLEVSKSQRLRRLEGESARPKRLLAETMLANAMLKAISAEHGDARSRA